MSLSGYSVAMCYVVSGDTMCVEDQQGSSTQGGYILTGKNGLSQQCCERSTNVVLHKRTKRVEPCYVR